MGLADVDQRMEKAKNSVEETTEKEKEKENENMANALDMRRKATQSLSKMRKRKDLDREESTLTRKQRTSDIIYYISYLICLGRVVLEQKLFFKEPSNKN